VTTEKDPSRLIEATSYNLEVSTCSDSSEQTKQHALRTRCLRSDAGMLPAAKPRTGAWGRSLTINRLTPGSSARINTSTVCGESPTASAFALWLACNLPSSLPAHLVKRSPATPPRLVLFYNNYRLTQHSLILLERFL